MKGAITMADYLKRFIFRTYFNTDETGGQGGSGGQPNPTGNEVEQQAQKLFESKKAEFEQQIRKEIEEQAKLTNEEKLAKERQTFENEKKAWQQKQEEQTKALNVEKVKNIYAKNNIPEKLVNELISLVSLDYSTSEKQANNIVSAYKKAIEDEISNLKTKQVNNQQTDTNSFNQTNESAEKKAKKQPKKLFNFD